MSAVDTLRDAIFGNPPVAGFKPSREGVLKAFTELLIIAGSPSGDITAYETVALMNADTTKADGDLARVYKNNGSSDDAGNGFYQWTGTAWERALWLTELIASSPDILNSINIRQTEIAALTGRAAIYGITNPIEANLFFTESVEIDFADDYNRDRFDQVDTPYDINGFSVVDGAATISNRGLFVSGPASPLLFDPPNGDFTVFVEIELPAGIGQVNTLVSIVGSSLNDYISAYRSDTNTYAVRSNNNGGATFTPAPIIDGNARRVKVAISSTASKLTAVFDGGDVLTVNAPQPTGLLRLWFGRLSSGNGAQPDVYIKSIMYRKRSTSPYQLALMTGAFASNTSNNGSGVDSSHENDINAHDLENLRLTTGISESKTGIWSIDVFDSFTGADGTALGNSEIGGKPWVTPAGLVRKGGRVQHPSSGSGGAWLTTATSDGQVEGDLYPGTNEASLYVRMNAANQKWLILQRTSAGDIGFYIQDGATIPLVTPIALPVVAGERFKVRFIGSEIWVFRVLIGVETLLFHLFETRLMTETIHGLRLNGGGSVDNFRVRNREAI